MVHNEFVENSMPCLLAKFHMPNSDDELVTAIKHRFRVIDMLLFYNKNARTKIS